MADNAQRGLDAVATAQALTISTRKARGLVAWLDDTQATALLSRGQLNVALSPEAQRTLNIARNAFAKRKSLPSESLSNIEMPPPPDVEQYAKTLLLQPALSAFVSEAWDCKLIDLRYVRCIQPHIFIEEAKQRVVSADKDDLLSLAAITMPMPSETPIPVQFDQNKMAWVFGSKNPNLRISGNFSGQVRPGAVGFGFTVDMAKSYMQVAKIDGKYVLRDGYHRAMGLLQNKIYVVPVLIKRFDAFSNLGLPPSSALSPSIYLSDTAPLLPDYLDRELSADIDVPAVQKTIIIQGLEFVHLG